VLNKFVLEDIEANNIWDKSSREKRNMHFRCREIFTYVLRFL